MNQPTPLHDAPDVDMADRLSAALNREADKIQPSNRLEVIKNSTRVKAGSPPPWLAMVAAAAGVAATVAITLSLVLPHQGPTPQVGGPATATAVTATPIPNANSAPAPTATDPTAHTTERTADENVVVFWLGNRNTLAAEVVHVPSTGNRSQAAVRGMLTLPAAINHGTGPWHNPEVNAAKVTVSPANDGGLVIDLPHELFDTQLTVTDADARLALQQLAYTATQGNTGQPVTITIDHRPGSAWGVPVGQPFTLDAAVRTSEPTGLYRRDGSTVTLTVGAPSETSLHFRVTTAQGAKVTEGALAQEPGTPYPLNTLRLELKPGTYLITVFTPGTGGKAETVLDQTTFTIE